MAQNSHEVTQLLIQWSNGDKTALNKLMPLIYNELRQLAPEPVHFPQPHSGKLPTISRDHST